MPLASKSWLSAEIRDPHESSDLLSVCYVPDTLHVFIQISPQGDKPGLKSVSLFLERNMYKVGLKDRKTT